MDYDQSVASQMGLQSLKAATRLLVLVLLGWPPSDRLGGSRYHGPASGSSSALRRTYFGRAGPTATTLLLRYGAYPYYYPPVVVERVAPPVYINSSRRSAGERGRAAAINYCTTARRHKPTTLCQGMPDRMAKSPANAPAQQ